MIDALLFTILAVLAHYVHKLQEELKVEKLINNNIWQSIDIYLEALGGTDENFKARVQEITLRRMQDRLAGRGNLSGPTDRED